MNPIVEVQQISKSFGATQALRGVSFSFFSGEIFALVGANVAGKSTLIKIICGYYEDYEGEIRIDGQRVRFHSPQDSFRQGIRAVHQIIDQGVVPTMSIAENLALTSYWTLQPDYVIVGSTFEPAQLGFTEIPQASSNLLFLRIL